jgi:hypothetical protein
MQHLPKEIPLHRVLVDPWIGFFTRNHFCFQSLNCPGQSCLPLHTYGSFSADQQTVDIPGQGISYKHYKHFVLYPYGARVQLIVRRHLSQGSLERRQQPQRCTKGKSKEESLPYRISFLSRPAGGGGKGNFFQPTQADPPGPVTL